MTKFMVLLLINPLIMCQLFAANKEIFIITSLLFMLSYIYSGKKRYLLAALIIAGFSKAEFLFLIVCFLPGRRLSSSLRIFSLITVVVITSIIYPNLPLMVSRGEILLRGQNVSSLGVTVMLQQLAMNDYLYALGVIPKLLLSIFEGMNGITAKSFIFSGQLFVFLSGVCFFIVMMVIFFKARFKIISDEVFLLCLFLLMVATVPFPHHRYILPIYPYLVFIALRPKYLMKRL